MPTAGVERQDSFKSVLKDVKRKLSTTQRKNSKQECTKSNGGSPFSSLKSTPFSSNQASPNRSPFTKPKNIPEQPEDEPVSECPGSRSPLPPGSPLLVTRAMSPALQRARSFNKELRRQASFRAAREKQSLSRNNSPNVSRTNSPAVSRNPSPEREEPVSQQQEMAFRVKKCLGSRKGWKIIPDNDDNLEDINTVALRTVVSMIKDMECQGFAVPERISVKV